MKTKLVEHLEKVIYFQIVGESSSIQEASNRIGIAQPALSKSIKILEEAVGCRLLERTRRGTVLTMEGEFLLKFSYGIQDLIKNFESEVFPSKKGVVGSLKIGTHELYVPHLWPEILNLSKKISPDLELNLVTDVMSSRLIQQLEANQLDIVIAINSKVPVSISKSLFYQDTYGFYGSNRFQGQSKKIEKVFYHPNSVIDENQKLQDLINKNGFDLAPTYNVSSYASILSLIMSGVGIGILPDKPASFYSKKKFLKKISNLSLKQKSHKVYIYTRASSNENRSIQFFILQILNNLKRKNQA